MKHLTKERSCNLHFRLKTLCLIIILITGTSHLIFGQCLTNKTAGTNPADISALDAAYNVPSPYVYGNMLGINDAGQFQSIENELNPLSYLTTKMRAFHAMDYDFNDNLIYGTPYAQLTKPKDVGGVPPYMDIGNYAWFYGSQGMTNISAATEILNKEPDLTWKEKIWQESDWWPAAAGLSIPAGIRESYKKYTESFIDVLAPNSGTRHVEVYQVGNELWDYPYEEDYHAMLEGAYDAFVNKYGTNTANWKMQLMPGSFQAATITNTCPSQLRNNSNCTTSGTQMFNQMGDYLDVSNCNILSSLHAINTHVYPFDEGTLNYVHPEKAGGEFERFKAAVAFRDANPILAGKGVWLTEVGYDSYGEGFLPNGQPASGVGQYSQAAMSLRIFMITSRYHLERVDFYVGFDQSLTTNPWHGALYNCSGFWRLGTHPQYGYGSAKPSHGATPKPVFFAFRNFLDKFDNKVFHEAVAEENDLHAYIIANTDGTDPYLVFWNPTATDDNNVFSDVNVNRTVSLPNGYKVSTTSATPFSTTGSNNDPYLANTAPSFSNAVSGTNAGSTTITKARRMPSYIQLETSSGTSVSFNSCPNNITIQAAAGASSAQVNWTTPTASTTCSGNAVVSQTAGGSNGSNFSIGTSTVSYQATDNCGNSTTCSFTVTVTSTVGNPLTLSCPNDILITAAQGASGANVSWPNPTATTTCVGGGCDGNPISGFSYLGELNGSDYYLSQGSEKWTDAKVTCENNGGHLATISSQAEHDFIFNNINAAVLIGLSDDDNDGSLNWVTNEPLSYNNWNSNEPNVSGTNRYASLNYWSSNGAWEIVNFWTSKPYILEVPCGGGNGIPTITQTQGPSNGSYFNIGTTSIAYSASDDCNNTDNCSFTITVLDNLASTLTLNCPADITVTAPTGANGMNVSWTTNASTTCSGNVMLSQTGGASSGSFFTIGTYFISYQATDNCGNVETCQFVVTVESDGGGDCTGSAIAGFNYLGESNGSDYYLSQFSQRWTNAKVTCENNGGHLVTIGSQAEQSFIFNNINAAVLIGISDDDTNGTSGWSSLPGNGRDENSLNNNGPLEWVTGEPISYTNWNSGQPDIYGTTRYGLLNYWTTGGKWEITNFWTNKPFVLEVPCSSNRLAPKDIALTLFPNPVKDVLHVHIPENAVLQQGDFSQVLITNTLGQQVQTLSVQASEQVQTVDVSQLGKGIYFIHLKGENYTTQAAKFVVY